MSPFRCIQLEPRGHALCRFPHLSRAFLKATFRHNPSARWPRSSTPASRGKCGVRPPRATTTAEGRSTRLQLQRRPRWSHCPPLTPHDNSHLATARCGPQAPPGLLWPSLNTGARPRARSWQEGALQGPFPDRPHPHPTPASGVPHLAPEPARCLVHSPHQKVSSVQGDSPPGPLPANSAWHRDTLLLQLEPGGLRGTGCGPVQAHKPQQARPRPASSQGNGASTTARSPLGKCFSCCRPPANTTYFRQ